MYRYAQIDDDSIVMAESYLSGEVIADNMILLTDEVIEIGKMKYIDGEFVPYEPPTPPYIPTQLDRIETNLSDADDVQAELLFNQANAELDTQLILETLAEILLNQQGV